MTQYPQQVQSPHRPVLNYLAKLHDIAIKLGSIQSKLVCMGEDMYLIDTIMNASFDKMAEDLPDPKLDYNLFQDLTATEADLPLILLEHGALARFRSGVPLTDEQNKIDFFIQLMAMFALSVSKLAGSPLAKTAGGIPASIVVQYLHQLAATGLAPLNGRCQDDLAASAHAAGAAGTQNRQFLGYPQAHESMAMPSSSSQAHHSELAVPELVPTSANYHTAPNSSIPAQSASIPSTQTSKTVYPIAATEPSTANATPAPTVSSIPRSSLSWEERSQLLIMDLELTPANYRNISGRTYFVIADIAKHFAPTIDGPEAANKHARTYGVMKRAGRQATMRRGVRKQANRWILTLEAFEEYVLSHFSEPADIVY